MSRENNTRVNFCLKVNVFPLKPFTEIRFSKTQRFGLCFRVKSKSRFLRKKCEFLSCSFFFFFFSCGPPLPKRLNCWLIFVSQLDSLPLALRLLPLILTRLLTPKSEDPSSLASGNELVRWALRFIAHEAGVSLCECWRVYRGNACACVNVCVCVIGNVAFTALEIYCMSALLCTWVLSVCIDVHIWRC